MIARQQVLIIVTSFGRIDERHVTGLWLEEFAIPYLALTAAGYGVTIGSPAGGRAPVDPQSVAGHIPPAWQAAAGALAATKKLDVLRVADYDAIIFPGGHGPMFDLATNRHLAGVLPQFAAAGKVIGAVCHGPAALVSAVMPDGKPLLAGKRVTAFTNEEETTTHLQAVVPFFLETRLKALGAEFSKSAPGVGQVVVDGNLVTGQNKQACDRFTQAVLTVLANRAKLRR
ncbi:type 1 glutamine amidotransferase domain-containing protein [Sporomusa termitida]|uniref:Protein/nucleic acid deglycase 2 n=1 Tax=Sporomusa termitida TaxID=2377 RepID=A0A517DWA3_9FIRM|nr:type 1 glutamine amidotransferase domain-containing protein [Sporomusa termitida]QDR81631.1 Protein/nucleic acid deglycase 2 [Sporomusa termitida]